MLGFKIIVFLFRVYVQTTIIGIKEISMYNKSSSDRILSQLVVMLL